MIKSVSSAHHVNKNLNLLMNCHKRLMLYSVYFFQTKTVISGKLIGVLSEAPVLRYNVSVDDTTFRAHPFTIPVSGLTRHHLVYQRY